MVWVLFAILSIPNAMVGITGWQIAWAFVAVVFSAVTIEDRNDPARDFAGQLEASLILIQLFTVAWWFVYLSISLADMGSQALIEAGWK
jgi:hypothetical protein